MKVLLRFLSFLALVALAGPGYAAHGIAFYGTLKYKSNFEHFAYANPAAPKGGTLKLSANAPFDSMNPFILRGIAAPGLTGYVFQTLMTPSYDEPQSYYGLIADSVTLAPDRAYADFTLNPAARWADGQPITADDVVWSFTALKEKGHPSFRIQYKPITVKKLATRSVRFYFEDKSRRELALMAASMPVLPKHYYCEGVVSHQPVRHSSKSDGGSPVVKNTEDWRLKTDGCVSFDKTTLAPPLGSGPYRVASVDPGRGITFERDKNYWAANLPSQRGFFNFDTIRIDIYRDDVTALEGIKSHQFDFYEEYIARNWATAYDIPAVKSGDLIKTLIPHQLPRGMQGFLFNTRNPKFADRRVREAIGLTLDFEWMNRVLFYGAYARNRSYFNHTEFEATGLPDAQERALLSPYHPSGAGDWGLGTGKESTVSIKNDPALPAPSPQHPAPYYLPPTLFTSPYSVPTTDGSGNARANLIRAQTLLNDAGWIMKNGARINSTTGERLTVEFLMTQRTFERVIAIMKRNLTRLGIDATFRYVDASQYQKRVDHREFDIVSIWWNQGSFYPGAEQYAYWHSSQADVEGSQNLGGIKNPVVDMLTEKILRAQTLGELRPAGRALDRVLTHEHYVIPHWNINAWRVLYWNQFGRPDITPAYNLGVDTWWQAAPAVGKEGK